MSMAENFLSPSSNGFSERDQTELLRDRIETAAAQRRPLAVVGRGSKGFYGHPVAGDAFCVAEHAGVVHYEPSELVITARTGTPLAEIERLLDAHHQMLPFEPPHFGPDATLGGCLATGLSGPRRPFAGAVRDLMLGCQIINGRGQLMRFGGQVMKNVAGYDISRLMVGALGTLGVMLEASVKVLPRPAVTRTVVVPTSAEGAIKTFSDLGARPVPLAGCAHLGDRAYLRLAGTRTAVEHAIEHGLVGYGAEVLDSGATIWDELRELKLAFFSDTSRPLWRISVPATTPPLAELTTGAGGRLGIRRGDELIDWCGAQRWVYSSEEPDAVRTAIAALGGHATLFRGAPPGVPQFHPLPEGLMALHRELKRAFDPYNILNPGRLYPDL